MADDPMTSAATMRDVIEDARRQQADDQLEKWYPAGTLDDDPEWVRDMIEAMLDDPEHRCWGDPDV